MNYIERIQKSIDFIEVNLQNKIVISDAANKAFMSLSSFYRLFFALVGFTVKEYIRLRRISLAANEIKGTYCRVLDVAIKYDFTSSDSFSRAFKRCAGELPSVYKHSEKYFNFERINIMDIYLEIQDQEMLRKYPNIKLMKKTKDVKVAYYCYYGENPEQNAFKVMNEWLVTTGINPTKQRLRIFGYNNPSPTSSEQKEYGYEVCVTIDDNTVISDKRIKTKTLKGALYAILGIKFKDSKDPGMEILKNWQILNEWFKEGKYEYDKNFQWFEEHLSFNDDLTEFKGMDIYVPIKDK
ncbi:AraC family transcriptional regulator [Clostridium sp. 'deep sea']|uniref:AraC family transcriptional regulator n=1 Tax=Clostridium sp. 'deep sea' TaxID=2779445 RepID=UPI0018965F45|nr:AraC family transcriptional regulator [Clostridium sp. 'deep sea']QOR35090.1 AraC family transcriptional regulator [Clostridium sp. 'deep sea']